MDGVLDCVKCFYPDYLEAQNEVFNRELLRYKNKEGGFGRALAAKRCEVNDENYDPGNFFS